jgi:hypothetical protein
MDEVLVGANQIAVQFLGVGGWSSTSDRRSQCVAPHFAATHTKDDSPSVWCFGALDFAHIQTHFGWARIGCVDLGIRRQTKQERRGGTRVMPFMAILLVHLATRLRSSPRPGIAYTMFADQKRLWRNARIDKAACVSSCSAVGGYG